MQIICFCEVGLSTAHFPPGALDTSVGNTCLPPMHDAASPPFACRVQVRPGKRQRGLAAPRAGTSLLETLNHVGNDCDQHPAPCCDANAWKYLKTGTSSGTPG
ncbi:hypothetical protein KIL84_016578 [Mauremys mutica]|uniref:Uncharacterized protein n=1 Tax=Mauremys mutica TaxID=74926 RepID=A0A9D4AWJ6_9SAUR|nr:hypothetical protein KIL84_016578 [Mauremys mutica]